VITLLVVPVGVHLLPNLPHVAPRWAPWLTSLLSAFGIIALLLNHQVHVFDALFKRLVEARTAALLRKEGFEDYVPRVTDRPSLRDSEVGAEGYAVGEIKPRETLRYTPDVASQRPAREQ